MAKRTSWKKRLIRDRTFARVVLGLFVSILLIIVILRFANFEYTKERPVDVQFQEGYELKNIGAIVDSAVINEGIWQLSTIRYLKSLGYGNIIMPYPQDSSLARRMLDEAEDAKLYYPLDKGLSHIKEYLKYSDGIILNIEDEWEHYNAEQICRTASSKKCFNGLFDVSNLSKMYMNNNQIVSSRMNPNNALYLSLVHSYSTLFIGPGGSSYYASMYSTIDAWPKEQISLKKANIILSVDANPSFAINALSMAGYDSVITQTPIDGADLYYLITGSEVDPQMLEKMHIVQAVEPLTLTSAKLLNFKPKSPIERDMPTVAQWQDSLFYPAPGKLTNLDEDGALLRGEGYGLMFDGDRIFINGIFNRDESFFLADYLSNTVHEPCKCLGAVGRDGAVFYAYENSRLVFDSELTHVNVKLFGASGNLEINESMTLNDTFESTLRKGELLFIHAE